MSEEIKEQNKKRSAKVFSIICSVLTAIFIALTAYVLISMIVARSKNKPVNLFGVSFAVVLTDSMEPEINTGDLIFFKKAKFSSVKEGDNIVFIAGEGFDEAVRGQSIVHKAITITESGIITKGVNNSIPDSDLVTSANFLGICTKHSSFLGAVFVFLNKYGILVLVAVFAIPFIIAQLIKIVRLSKKTANARAADGQVTNGDTAQPLSDGNNTLISFVEQRNEIKDSPKIQEDTISEPAKQGDREEREAEEQKSSESSQHKELGEEGEKTE